MGKVASKTCLAAVASLILPSLAWAAGLGKLSVLSQLGQPLRAEIEIVSLQRGEGDTLGARLAPGELFRQANIDLNPALLSMKFAVQRRPSGQYVMILTSGQPINEPFLDMLVELNWANGRLVREYTFLLDPPEYAGPRKLEAFRAAQPPAAVRPEVIALAPPASDGPVAPVLPLLELVPASPDAPAEPTASSQTAVVELALPGPDAGGGSDPAQTDVQVLPADVKPAGPMLVPVDAESGVPELTQLQEPGISDTYEVVRGDTLSKIAIRNRIEGVTFQQMLVALFRANQEAFVADNMNRLRAGKIVRIPDKDAAAAVATADARRIVSAQYADFNEYRRSLGIAVASTPAPQGGRQASGQVSAPKEEKPVPSKEPPKDELRLSRADEAKRGAGAAGTAAADDLAAKNNALKEANERIALLEKNLQDMQKLRPRPPRRRPRQRRKRPRHPSQPKQRPKLPRRGKRLSRQKRRRRRRPRNQPKLPKRPRHPRPQGPPRAPKHRSLRRQRKRQRLPKQRRPSSQRSRPSLSLKRRNPRNPRSLRPPPRPRRRPRLRRLKPVWSTSCSMTPGSWAAPASPRSCWWAMRPTAGAGNATRNSRTAS